jgi:Xaa-Pro aminopeptidase
MTCYRTRGMAILLVCLSIAPNLFPAPQKPQPLPPLRKQAEIQQQWLKVRLERVLPQLMRKHGVAMWLVICREYNEDPAFFSLVPPTVLSARRRTILVFFDRGPAKGVERLALGGGSNGGFYQVLRDPSAENRELWGEGQWTLLRKVIEQRNPGNIAVDISQDHAFSDGLSASEWEKLQQVLGPEYRSRIIHAGLLPLEYISVRIPEMLPIYRQLMETAHWLIGRAFSSEVIQPGKTTTQDVVWWLRQELNDLGLGTWFQPSVRIQRKGFADEATVGGESADTIERGDALHMDFGIQAMGLATDTQHMAYVLRAGEEDAPAGLREALAVANRLQDIVIARMKPGRTGNEILTDSLGAMRAEKINGAVYSHPIGDHGHGAGPLVGLWDRQEGVPGRGDVPVLPDTWFSIELNVRVPIPEWGGQELLVGAEEDISIDADGRASWVQPRQTSYHLVR